MLKEFIQHIQETTRPVIQEVDGHTFAITSEGAVEEVRPELDRPVPLPLQSLDALVKLVRTEALRVAKPLYITIPNHLTVRCFGQPQANTRYFRQAGVF